MKRKQLFQFHEQTTVPVVLRKSIVEFLQFSTFSTDNEDEPAINGSGFYNKDSFLAMQTTETSNDPLEINSAGLSKKELSSLLTNLAWQKRTIRITDIKRSGSTVIPEILLTPINSLLFAIHPSCFSPRNFLFNWVIPIVPIAATWDRLAGHLRRYSEDELREIIEHIHVPGYSFLLIRSNEAGSGPTHYMIGNSAYQQAA